MDPNFTFPRQRPQAMPRPPPAEPPSEPVNRESNALRASVLDAALQLGLGSSKMANWMLNNTLAEDEEEPEEDTPSRAPLSPTSEESISYSTPPTSHESYSDPRPPPAVAPQVHFPPQPDPAPPLQPPSKLNKLRKQRRENGNDSDGGGYVSDGGKKARVRTKSKPTKPDPVVVFPISEPTELIPLSKEERKRKKKAAKGGLKDAETDTEDIPGKPAKAKSTKKTKKGSADVGAGYETDDGYVSSSGKKAKTRRFFSLRKKESTSELAPEPEPVPPLPQHEAFDLPIASRFATTLPPSGSRAETPLMPPARPFASGSSSPSSASSLLTPNDPDSSAANSPLISTTSSRFDEDGLHDRSHSTGMDRPVSPLVASNSKSKFLISLPLTRTGEQSSPSKAKTHLAPISLSPNPPMSGLNSRSVSPGPSPMGSPFVLLTPINTSSNPRVHSPANSGSTDIIPSTDFIVPSRSASPLPPSPNVLSYYDVPPPSPPPTGPLPRPPPSRDVGPGIARLRNMSRDRNGVQEGLSPIPRDPGSRSVSPSPISSPWSTGGRLSPLPLSPGARSPISPTQRGRAAPFPSQPIIPSRSAPNTGLGPGLAARVQVERYRDLYAIQIPDQTRDRYRDEDETSVNIRVQEGSDEEVEDDPEITGVLGRFRQPVNRERDAAALERNNSGALRPGTNTRRVRFSPQRSPTREAYSEEEEDDDDASLYPDDERTAGRKTMFLFDKSSSGNEDDTIGARGTVYSEYSRASFMDNGKSEVARGRLVDRVGAMFDSTGRERPAAPPVPRLPPELLAGANRF
ncbi:hypothetical protein MIND_01058700 [Mycena indigotica]|uniref:Uncharacterized protein n=1 Tax=Mycena indigotica TaxID=2126181 RepID=A0A8H6VV87_9AGAR|nr:uncharacterized protein MIND_01058700 [Mycena indigotica]KAF7295199.1 hypothetical protein MIND_01058700 [Mycena indigotica]